MDGTAAVGTSAKYAREDHVHPVDTSRASTAVATTSANGLMSSTDKTKLNGIATGAEVNVQADWNETNETSDAFILHKPDGLLQLDTQYLDGRRVKIRTEEIDESGSEFYELYTREGADTVHYGECSTAAATAAKTVACSSFNLVKGVWIAVKFTVTNTVAVADLRLNVNGTGAKGIKYRNALLPSAGLLSENRIYLFVYDGNCWQIVGDLNTNTTYTNMTQANASAGTATTANTISAKVLVDTINEKISAAQVGAAMFRGTVTANTDISNLSAYKKGWYWVVKTAGTYVGQACESGDMIFCVSDRGTAYAAADFSVVQNNLDLAAITNGEIDTILAS